MGYIILIVVVVAIVIIAFIAGRIGKNGKNGDDNKASFPKSVRGLIDMNKNKINAIIEDVNKYKDAINEYDKILLLDSNNFDALLGKAKNLRNRVKSYFLKNQNYKTQKLVENISDIEFVLTDNESEAFLLESNMIKKYRPRFNIELKDQQRYTYLRISDEKYPRLLVSRRTRGGKFLGKGKTFGPFTQGSSKLLTIGTLRKAFQIRICKTLPKKVCLEYHLRNCEGPCEFKDAQERYAKYVSSLEDVLKGKNQTKIFTKKLEEEMHQAAELQQFEQAKDIRDTLIRLGSLQTKQKMEYVENSDEEYFGIGLQEHSATVMNFRMINGVIRDSDKFFFDLVGDNSFSNFLYQYYSTHKIPRFILVSELPEKHELLESLLSEQSGYEVKILTPIKGKRKNIINLIMKNIQLIHLKNGKNKSTKIFFDCDRRL